MYKPTAQQWAAQAERLRNLDLRLVIGFLKTSFRWAIVYPKRPVPHIVEGYRSPERQDILYNQGRTTPGPKVTEKKGGESKHNSWPSLAADIGFWGEDGQEDYSEENYRLFYELWQEHTKGFIWGGTWKSLPDRPHFEVTPIVQA